MESTTKEWVKEDPGNGQIAHGLKSHDVILLVVVLVGVVLRIRQFAFARSIWLDEATFANAILDSDVFGLVIGTQPFVDPVGYVLLTKFGTFLLGQTEFAFRWIALAAGIGAVIVSALLARRVFETALAKTTFTALVALAPVLVYYSDEAQQYSLDILAAVAALWLLTAFEDWRHGFTILVVFGVLFPWFSYASVIVLVGVGVALAVRWLRRGDYRRTVILGLAWGASAALSLVHARLVTRTQFLEDYWEVGFAPFPITSLAEITWYSDAVGAIVHTAWFGTGIVWRTLPSPGLESWLILGLIVMGWFLLARRRPWVALAFGVMALANLIVSILGLYPIGSRPGLYIIPLVFLLASEPLEWAAARGSIVWKIPAALVALALMAAVAVPSVNILADPHDTSDIKGALQYVVDNREPGESLIIHGWSSRAFEFYEERFELEGDAIEVSRDYDPIIFAIDIGEQPDLGRAWIVFSHQLRGARQFVDELSEIVPLLDQQDGGEYLVALFDLSDLN